MARIEPGLYEPADDVRVFDGAEDDMDDEGSRLPLLIVIALLVLAAFAGVVWLAYTQGVQRGRQDVPRVIAAENGPVKTVPGEPGGVANPYRGLKIYNNKASADTQGPLPSIITQPGEPLFSAFGPKHPASAPAQAPKPAPVAPPPAQQMAAQSLPPAPVVKSIPAPTPAPAKPPIRVAAQEPTHQAAPPPPPKPAPIVMKPAPIVAKAVAPPVVKSTPAPVKAPPPPASAVTSTISGGYVAQIGAFKSQAEAETGWAAFKRAHAGVVGGLSPSIVSVDLGEKGTWYRVRTGAFTDKASASDFCAKLKAEGASCLPAKG